MTKNNFNFAQAFAELQKITQEFEQGDLDLDEGLKKFERGLKLAQLCKKRLAEAENEIRQIKAKFGQEQKEKMSVQEPAQAPDREISEEAEVTDKQLF